MVNLKRGLAVEAARQVAPRITAMAPGITSAFVRHALDRAIKGVGPLPGAAAAAEAQLREQKDTSPQAVDKAIRDLIENHVRYAGIEGFVTNVGGLVTAAVVAPANITGLALVQARMVAGIAHLRGYDIDDPRVRNAILVAMLGQEVVTKMVKKLQLPAPPMALATAPEHDPALDNVVTQAVAGDLVTDVIGKRLATTVGRRIPLIGGAVGAVSDGYDTWKVGRYADREFLPRTSR